MMKQQVKQVPYGVSDFATVMSQNLYYVDKTMFLPELEKQPRNLFFVRPRRFGKSLFLSMLYSYYDCNQKESFEKLFGSLWIGQHPTSLQGIYQVLFLDFSQITGKIEVLEERFNAYLCIKLDSFAEQYAAYYGDKKVQEIKEELSDIPEAASEKVEVYDLTRMTEIQLKHFTEVQAILIKKKDGEELDQDELDSLEKWYKGEYEDIVEEKVEVTVKDAVTATQKAIDYAKKSGEAIAQFAAKVKTKAEEELKKAEIAGEAGAIAMCTKQLSKIQSLIMKLTEEKTKVLAPIEKNIAIIKSSMKETEIKLATNRADAKYGTNIFKKVGGRIRSSIRIPSSIPSIRRWKLSLRISKLIRRTLRLHMMLRYQMQRLRTISTRRSLMKL